MSSNSCFMFDANCKVIKKKADTVFENSYCVMACETFITLKRKLHLHSSNSLPSSSSSSSLKNLKCRRKIRETNNKNCNTISGAFKYLVTQKAVTVSFFVDLLTRNLAIYNTVKIVRLDFVIFVMKIKQNKNFKYQFKPLTWQWFWLMLLLKDLCSCFNLTNHRS